MPGGELPKGGGYVKKAPDQNGRWDVSVYQFSPATVVVRQGERVRLELIGINGANVAGDNLDHALVWTVAAAGGGGGGTTNTTPSAGLQATRSTSIRVGGSVSVRASFTDPDNGPWSYKVDWGDGSVTAGNTSSGGTISGISPHVYTRRGSFKATLTVTDSKGAAGKSKTISVRVR